MINFLLSERKVQYGQLRKKTRGDTIILLDPTAWCLAPKLSLEGL